MFYIQYVSKLQANINLFCLYVLSFHPWPTDPNLVRPDAQPMMMTTARWWESVVITACVSRSTWQQQSRPSLILLLSDKMFNVTATKQRTLNGTCTVQWSSKQNNMDFFGEILQTLIQSMFIFTVSNVLLTSHSFVFYPIYLFVLKF